MKRFAIALALCSCSPFLSHASVITTAPVATMTVGGSVISGLTPILNALTGVYSFGSTPGTAFATGTNYILNSISFDAFSDPYIDYGDSVTNTGTTPLTVSFTITDAYIGGPYTTLTDSFADAVTDSGTSPNGNVTISVPAGSAVISQPMLNGVNVDGIGTGCVLTGTPGFSMSGCTPVSMSPKLTTITDPATGTFSIALDYTISPGDIYSFNGRISLSNTATPEPATVGYLAIGLLGMACFAAVRRKGFKFGLKA